MVKNGLFEGSTYMTENCVPDLKIDIQPVFSNIVAFVEFEIDRTKIMKILGGVRVITDPYFCIASIVEKVKNNDFEGITCVTKECAPDLKTDL